MISTYEFLESLLPYELAREGNAIKFKKIIGAYSELSDEGMDKEITYGDLLDVMTVKGTLLDGLGNMFLVTRLPDEDDEDYRNRILNSTIERKIPVTVPEIQKAVDAVVTSGRLIVRENHGNRHANIFLTGTADEASIKRALVSIQKFLPTGVSLIVPIVSFDTWQNIKDQFSSWQTLKDSNYIW